MLLHPTTTHYNLTTVGNYGDGTLWSNLINPGGSATGLHPPILSRCELSSSILSLSDRATALGFRDSRLLWMKAAAGTKSNWLWLFASILAARAWLGSGSWTSVGAALGALTSALQLGLWLTGALLKISSGSRCWHLGHCLRMASFQILALVQLAVFRRLGSLWRRFRTLLSTRRHFSSL